MEKQKINPKYKALAVLGVLALVSIFLFWPKPLHQLRKGEVYLKIGDTGYMTQVAKTTEARAKGLSERESLCRECAMVFVFDAPGQYGFWMKDMRFPLDILWVRNGKVVHKESNVSEKRTDVMKPNEEAELVIETNPNSETKVGDVVQIDK